MQLFHFWHGAPLFVLWKGLRLLLLQPKDRNNTLATSLEVMELHIHELIASSLQEFGLAAHLGRSLHCLQVPGAARQAP